MQSHAPETLAEARKEFEAELKLNPADAVAEYEIGQILLAENKPQEAAPRFERALATSPDYMCQRGLWSAQGRRRTVVRNRVDYGDSNVCEEDRVMRRVCQILTASSRGGNFGEE